MGTQTLPPGIRKRRVSARDCDYVWILYMLGDFICWTLRWVHGRGSDLTDRCSQYNLLN